MGYIDAHTHAWFREFLPQNFSSKNAGYEFKPPSLQQVLKEMDSANIDYIVIIAYPARELWNIDESIAIQAIDFLKPYGERFSVVGGIEPNKLTVEETKYWLGKQYEKGVAGFKLHPVHSWVKPNAYREEEGGLKQLEIMYQFAEDHNLPVIIHTGTSMFLRARNKYGDPIYIDDVSVDFPRLKIVMAHMGRPNWVPTAFQLCRIRRNIYAEISSIPPKKILDYLPRIEEISNKTIYGSDYGGPGTKGLAENLKEFLSLNIEGKEDIADKNPRSLYKTLK
ncbi:amidohydrolase family protein [Sulfolobus acidocaldarius]|uniref:Conserved amidohydrolase n=4 Tax=Sulfolobus acidocaldarius TaxID=2285 RepID=Q4J6Q1_SULAC|nr:amidohydrolase family protein [Sulfolobus acidocaldarius]AAY81530.1 conserved amidohydrolase [Sulfolobus acidocaldarius DSM 639]AGE72133.1 amidohydrolase [Sulfolobus acidocaldarius N8]AGE74450.1 amidohydrolase [Sulfolobus acidocaldarius Ron12/I]ALU29693.1 amidohydrolase [Sulfolobus acidocaldarius]ALU32428.1 amidohydrolase [Sulfolobus acidocaldarius]